MKSSNIEGGLRVMFTQTEIDEINDKCGMVSFWSLKQIGPLEFMLSQAEEGKGLAFSKGYGDHPSSVQFSKDRPKTIANRFWGMSECNSVAIIRQGVKFSPDMSMPVIRRPRGTEAERIHKRAEAFEPKKDDGALMSLREFTTAVDKVNKFVTENEGHVVLDINSGLLKFLVEG
jgi:hypothetical protein